MSKKSKTSQNFMTLELNGTRPITIKDVAERAGVTAATVSFTLSGKRNASAKTKDAILKAAQELGYVPNPYAQRLANGGCNKTIGLLWAMDLGVSTEQANFIYHRLDEAGYLCDSLSTPNWVSDTHLKQLQMVKTLCRREPRAIICRINELQEPAFEQLQRYKQDGGTVVCYGNKGNGIFDHVVFDKVNNIYRAALHLLDLGHRKIGLSVQSDTVLPGDEGAIGFHRALSERGVEVREDWIWGHCCYEEAGARLAETFLKLQDRPTALCVINDVTASVFIAQLYRKGLRVPDDVSVVGYDNAPVSRYGLVPITTISHPVAGIARPLLEMLFSRLDGGYDGPARRVEVKGELIVRDSTAAPQI
jgi:LacI family purine nucleotide synthesis repressor